MELAKPIAYYDPRKTVKLELGIGALIWPLEHPDKLNISCTKYVFTSPVVALDVDTGEFETLNTRYLPREL